LGKNNDNQIKQLLLHGGNWRKNERKRRRNKIIRNEYYLILKER